MAFQVKATRKDAPVRAVVYGPPGIGKSTLGASAPSPIFVSLEDGLSQIDAAAIEPAPKTWTEALDALDYIATLDHQTVVIDSLDHLEPLCWAHVCEKGGVRILGKKGNAEVFGGAKVEHIEAFGYGKGYNAALDEWRVFIRKLDRLRAKGMHAILIAHAVRKMFKNPLGDDYEQWTIKLQEKATGLLIEKCEVVGFLSEDVATEDSSGRAKAQATGKRVLRVNPNPAYLAKTRFEMPSKLVLPKDRPWDVFAAALKPVPPETAEERAAREKAARDQLTTELEAKLVELADKDVEAKVRAFVADNDSTPGALAEAIERLDITIAERRKAS